MLTAVWEPWHRRRGSLRGGGIRGRKRRRATRAEEVADGDAWKRTGTPGSGRWSRSCRGMLAEEAQERSGGLTNGLEEAAGRLNRVERDVPQADGRGRTPEVRSAAWRRKRCEAGGPLRDDRWDEDPARMTRKQPEEGRPWIDRNQRWGISPGGSERWKRGAAGGVEARRLRWSRRRWTSGDRT